MMIEAISALGLGAAGPAGASRSAQGASDTSFNTLLDGIERLNGQMHADEQAIQKLALGEADNLHQVMMTLERTRLAFELVLQVRNKALEAYQELMRMQV